MNDRLELDLVEATIIRLHAGREINDKERQELDALVEIAKAARVRLEYGHNDVCDLELGDSTQPHPCTCGHHELREALSVLDDREAGEPRD